MNWVILKELNPKERDRFFALSPDKLCNLQLRLLFQVPQPNNAFAVKMGNITGF